MTSLEPCRDILQLREYIDTHWRKGHILARDAAMLYRLLEDEVVPEFYAGDGLWARRVKNSLKTLAGQFSATRMLQDYESKMYASKVEA